MSLKQDWENKKRFDWACALSTDNKESCFWCGKKEKDSIEDIVAISQNRTDPGGILYTALFCDECCYRAFEKARGEMDAAETYEERTHDDVVEHKHVSYPYWHPAVRKHTEA
jgi:hypothetical protein